MKYNWCGSVADTVILETVVFAAKPGERLADLVINKRDNFYDTFLPVTK